MKRHFHTFRLFAACMLAVLMFDCHNNSGLWNELPQKISEFISQYYPNSSVNSYTHSSGTYHVRLTDGPGITFDDKYFWIAVDGYGMPLPQVLLFDQLPPKVYSYLQETQQLNSVFSMQRDSTRYSLTLLDSDLNYDIATEVLSSPRPPEP